MSKDSNPYGKVWDFGSKWYIGKTSSGEWRATLESERRYHDYPTWQDALNAVLAAQR